jgi:methyl-accepting chemotaxis protein
MDAIVTDVQKQAVTVGKLGRSSQKIAELASAIEVIVTGQIFLP